MPILHSFVENKLEYEDADAVEIKMRGTRMDKESLEHNLYENDITPIICHNFSLTSNPPIKPKDPESIERFLNCFANQPNETSINDPESDDGSVGTPLVSPFPHSDNDSDDEELLNELSAYENARTLRRERIINSFDEDDFAFECMIGFRKFTAYLDPFLPIV
ncbi:hypothetical protein Tco_0008530 [Tanacetum coccineum]